MKRIKAIKNGFFSRNSSLVKYAIRTGKSVIQNRDDPKKILEGLIGEKSEKFISELSHFKGSITKAGQLLSQYAEIYIDEPLRSKLKALQSNTDYLEFEDICSQISKSVLDDFEISKKPIAAASIGQVHLAHLKESPDKKYILKVQYSGIAKAVDVDLMFLKMLMKAARFVPKGVDTKEVFNEIEKLLYLEMDYRREVETQEKYRSLLDDDYFYIPSIVKKYSDSKVICMEYIEGIPFGEIQHHQIPQDTLNSIGEKIFDLFLKEIFKFNLVQTDVHGGNYYISHDYKKVFLLDFGACLSFDTDVITHYQNFISFAFKKDRQAFFNEITIFLNKWDGSLKYDEDVLWDYICFLTDPLRKENYRWGDQRFIDDLFKKGKKLQDTVTITAVPHQFIFLDRKILGVYTLLSSLNAEFNVKRILENYIKR